MTLCVSSSLQRHYSSLLATAYTVFMLHKQMRTPFLHFQLPAVGQEKDVSAHKSRNRVPLLCTGKFVL